MNKCWRKSCIIIPQYNLSEKFDTFAWETNCNMRNIRKKENPKYVTKERAKDFLAVFVSYFALGSLADPDLGSQNVADLDPDPRSTEFFKLSL